MSRRTLLVLKVIAIVLPLIGFFQPFWVLNFNAPMFGQKWLTVTVWSYGAATGPLDQINIANHYVGLPPIEPDKMIELKMLPVAFILSAILAALIAFKGSSKLSLILIIIYLAILIGIPGYFQYWLYKFGHSIGPEAAVKIEPFTPLVIGSYKIANFKASTYFHIGYWLLVVSFILVILIRRMEHR